MTPAHPLRDRHLRRRLAHLLGADDRLPIDPDLEPTDPSEPGAPTDGRPRPCDGATPASCSPSPPGARSGLSPGTSCS